MCEHLIHSKKSNKFLNHTLTVISLSESNEKAKEVNDTYEHEITNNEQTVTIRALTSLIEESSKDINRPLTLNKKVLDIKSVKKTNFYIVQ